MTPPSHAAALMTADQYRRASEDMLNEAAEGLDTSLRDFLVQFAQVYALLAISAQAAENREDLPF